MKTKLSNYLTAFFLFLLLGFLACSKDPLDIVQKGILNIDSTVSVGDALNGYKFFKEKSWKYFKDPQNRDIVEFNGVLDFAKFENTEVAGHLLTGCCPNRTKAERICDIVILTEHTKSRR